MKKTIATITMALALGSWSLAQNSENNKNAVKITNGPVVEQVTDTTAQIAWSTNVNAGSMLHYGTDPNNLSQSASMPWGGLTHRIDLKGLKPDTTYYYKAESDKAQGSGTSAETSQASFKTKAAGSQSASSSSSTPASSANTPAPQSNSSVGMVTSSSLAAGPIAQLVKDTSAQIWWLGSQPSSGGTSDVLTYGTSANNMNQRVQGTPEGNGGAGTVAQLTNLQPDTTYQYTVFGPNNTVLAGGQFKTEPSNYASNRSVWITKGPVMEMIGPDSAVVAWSTNVRSGSIVRYGTDPNALNQTAEAPWGQDTHRVTIKNLKPGTRYYFEVQSTQAQGTNSQAQSQPAPFQTVGQGQQAVRNIQPR